MPASVAMRPPQSAEYTSREDARTTCHRCWDVVGDDAEADTTMGSQFAYVARLCRALARRYVARGRRVGDTIYLRHTPRLFDGQAPAKVPGPHLYSAPLHPHNVVFIGGVIKPQQLARVFVYLCRGLTLQVDLQGHLIRCSAAGAASVAPLSGPTHVRWRWV